LLLAAAAGCASYYAIDVVRDRAARDYRCPRGSVSVDDLDGGAYRAHACGHEALYVCNRELAKESDPAGSLYCVRNEGGGR